VKTICVDQDLFGPRREATVDIPPGWYRVLSGVLNPGDRCLVFDLF
jgi:hypothetical protein